MARPRVDLTLVVVKGSVYRDVAVDRRHAREPHGRVRRRAAHNAAEGERARVRADHPEVRRLRDQARGEAVVALERRERAETAVLLGGDHLKHHVPGEPSAARLERSERVESGHHAALHVHGTAAVHRAVLDRARPRAEPPRLGALRHHVHVAVQAEARRRLVRSRERDRRAPQLGARGLLARVTGARAQHVQVVLDHLYRESQIPSDRSRLLHRRALVAGHAANANEPARVAGDRVGIDCFEGFHAQVV